jgi:hypothetical protein
VIHVPIPRNTWSKTVRLVRIDELARAGLGFTANPADRCPNCGDRIGRHVLVLDGELSDAELAELLRTRRIFGTVENYVQPALPFACATFGVKTPRLA